MNKRVQSKIAAESARAELAEATIRRIRTERLAKDAQNRVDVLAPDAQRKRRQPHVETSGESKSFKQYDRLRGINLTRDLERNYSYARSALLQLRANVVGIGPKLRVHAGTDEQATTAANWFNSDWAHDCDFRGQSDHFGEQVENALAAVVREGDILAAFDDGWIEDSGKLIWWEADQLVEPDAMPKEYEGFKIDSGVVFDKWGRAVAYCVSSEHGRMKAALKDCTFIPAAKARLIAARWRPNMLRGFAPMLTCAADWQDLYEMRGKELQSAKVAATFAGKVKKQDAQSELELKRLAEIGRTGAPASNGDAVYDRFEALTGGNIEYMEPGDDFEIFDFKRPDVAFTEGQEAIGRGAAAALGLPAVFCTMKVTNSYTGFRGENLMAWQTFIRWQKLLERELCDWAARNAIDWAIRNGKLDPIGDYSLSWQWPIMPQVDPEKDARAVVLKLQHLLTTYADELGPNWRKIFEQLAEESKTAKSPGLRLPLRIFESEREGLRFSGPARPEQQTEESE